jgi:uncharacterized membrane protein YkoI
MKEREINWVKRAGAIAVAVALVIGLGVGIALYRTNQAASRRDRGLKASANNAAGDVASAANTENAAISPEEALQAAYDHAGVKADEATNVRSELDRDNGTLHYDIEFRVGQWEYDYEINAATGAVTKSERERND